jgi:thiol-disulfide isomerase/thioredoxin
MKNILRVISLMFSIALLAPPSASRADSSKPKPMAVLFYADWCTSCKLLEPKYEPARAGLEDQIQFVKLDVTNEATQQKARATAQALGIGPLYTSNHATGWVALVDGEHVQVGELKYDESVDDMHAALEKLAQGTPQS